MEKLLAIMAQLRDPARGCPWDLEQTFESIVPHTLEEAYEVADVIERGQLGELPGELGDLLFQVVFYCQLGRERGAFDFATVVDSISDKLMQRHPHVFGSAQIDTVAAQSEAWEAHKQREREGKAAAEARAPSVLDGVAVALPALVRAGKLQKRAAGVGFDWPNILPVFDKVLEELQEVRDEITHQGSVERVEAEIGDLLFTCVNLARHAGVNPETALRSANRRFEARFQRIEALLAERGQTPTAVNAEELERLWNQAKREEQGGVADA